MLDRLHERQPGALVQEQVRFPQVNPVLYSASGLRCQYYLIAVVFCDMRLQFCIIFHRTASTRNTNHYQGDAIRRCEATFGAEHIVSFSDGLFELECVVIFWYWVAKKLLHAFRILQFCEMETYSITACYQLRPPAISRYDWMDVAQDNEEWPDLRVDLDLKVGLLAMSLCREDAQATKG